MVKKIFTPLIFTFLFTIGGIGSVSARTAIDLIEQEFPTVTLSIVGNVLHVVGAEDELLTVYNVTGVKVMSLKVDGPDKRYTLNLPKGCYIIKVGKVVRKVSIS